MTTALAVAAAAGCALCNAFAAVLQKVSSDKVTRLRTYNLMTITQLVRKLPYAVGLALDLLAGVFTLVAASRLPLFLVQAIIASCIVLTAFFEKWFLKRTLPRNLYPAAAVVVTGLACVALAAHSEAPATLSLVVTILLLASPLVLILIGTLAIRSRHRRSFIVLGVLAGTGFGAVSIVGRVLVYPHPLTDILLNPLLWVGIIDGTLGMFFFTATLQRTLATIANGVMTASETIIPVLFGITLLGDTPKNGMWGLVWVGCALVVGGCSYIAERN